MSPCADGGPPIGTPHRQASASLPLLRRSSAKETRRGSPPSQLRSCAPSPPHAEAVWAKSSGSPRPRKRPRDQRALVAQSNRLRPRRPGRHRRCPSAPAESHQHLRRALPPRAEHAQAAPAAAEAAAGSYPRPGIADRRQALTRAGALPPRKEDRVRPVRDQHPHRAQDKSFWPKVGALLPRRVRQRQQLQKISGAATSQCRSTLVRPCSADLRGRRRSRHRWSPSRRPTKARGQP